MASALTAKAVESAKPGPARREVPDGALPGLYLIVQVSGAKSWALRYRHQGKPKKLTIGPTLLKREGEEITTALPLGQPMTLVEARRAARDALQTIAEGRDPGVIKKESAAAASAPVIPDDRNHVKVRGKQFIERYCKPKNKSWTEVQRQFRSEINPALHDPARRIPAFGDRNVGEVTKSDINDLLDAIVDRGSPVTANRVLATLKTFFGWLEGRDIITTSPAEKVKKPTTESSRERVLTDTELKLFWEATGGFEYPFGPMWRLLLLTGQRRQEVAGMRWSELSGSEWLIPGARTKNSLEHLVPLSPKVMEIVESLPRIGKAGFCFTTTGETSVSGFSRSKDRLDSAMLALLRKRAQEAGEEVEGVTLTDWTLHDLRRTMASGMGRLRVDTAVIEKCLNHISGAFGGIAGVYNRYAYLPEKTAALAAWANHVDALLSERQADNVLPFREAVV